MHLAVLEPVPELQARDDKSHQRLADAPFFDVLACPVCRGDLFDEGDQLRCADASCGAEFPMAIRPASGEKPQEDSGLGLADSEVNGTPVEVSQRRSNPSQPADSTNAPSGE